MAFSRYGVTYSYSEGPGIPPGGTLKVQVGRDRYVTFVNGLYRTDNPLEQRMLDQAKRVSRVGEPTRPPAEADAAPAAEEEPAAVEPEPEVVEDPAPASPPAKKKGKASGNAN